MKHRLYIVAWRAYGEWKTSMPFATEALAQGHINTQLLRDDRAEYNKNCQVIPIEVRAA